MGMTSPHHALAAVLVAILSLSAQAKQKPDIRCARDLATDAFKCVDLHQIKESNGLRVARLYTGGPLEVKDSGYLVAVNCQTQVMHLKDRQGVSFGGGSFNSTQVSKDLSAIMCHK